ncbi:MAG TPA: 4Fe-4S dicluster domain-containing protein [Rhodocyclaceae bacterium]
MSSDRKPRAAEAAPNGKRRAFVVAGATAMLGTLIAPGIRLIEVAGASEAAGKTRLASDKVRWGLLIDANRCASDCDVCVQACNKENHLPGGTKPTDVQWIRKIDLKDKGSGRELSLPMMCQHCANPPCVDVCPTGASMKRADGIVLVDRHSCIGCRYCMMACPYKARSFVHEPVTDQNPLVPRGKGCVESCTFCVHRVDAGRLPACVEACPNQAMLFGDLNDADSAISRRIRSVASTRVRADLGLDIAVRYEGI